MSERVKVHYVIELTEEQLVTMLASFGERLLRRVAAGISGSERGAYVVQHALEGTRPDIPQIAADVVHHVLHR